MPHATPRGPRGQRNRPPIVKPDPETLSSTTAPIPHARLRAASNHDSSASNYGARPENYTVDQSFIFRNGRSDAPTPSERPTESEPLLREVRIRPEMASESPPTNEDSFFHTSFQDIGKSLKASNDTLGELQQLGVSHDVQLPELVLVGDQSAGKSSLMSGLAYLDLPRSEGTCTRCPLHIRVSRNSDWSCRVWLRKEYSYRPPQDGRISENDVTEQDPFFPWRKQPVTTVHEFKSMHDKAEIEDVLRWAQIAILNDDKPHELFIPGSGPIAMNTDIAHAAEQTAAKFSPNVVALEIKGPDLPDLSFYDMPGIFQNPPDARDDYLVSVVRNLSKAYIEHPSAIIICAMPMNSDAENSSTFNLTRRLGATNRTIGVLTKADLLTTGGNHDQWLAIMRGEAHRTGFKYFITSRPQGSTLDELKQHETLMFEDGSFESWPSCFHDFRDKCGVEKLKAFLSERLGEEFAKSLPTIKRKVKWHLEKINKQLASLPELPANVELEIKSSLINFADASRQQIDEFIRSFNTLPTGFRNCLLHIKPKIVLKDKTDVPVVEISDDESEAGSVAGSFTTPTGSKRRNNAAMGSPSKRRGGVHTNGHLQLGPQSNGGASFSGHVKPEEGRNSLPPPPSPARKQAHALEEPFTKFTNLGRGFRTLREVRDEIAAKTTAGMPNRIPDKVYQELAIEAVKPWNDPMETFLKQTMHLLQVVLDTTMNQAFEKLKKRSIYKETRKALRQYLEKHRATTAKALALIYEDETSRLLTFNDEAFKQYENEEREILTHFRHYIRVQATASGEREKETPHVPWENLTEDKRKNELQRREIQVAKLGPDQFAREVDVVAYVRGYYRLAALRFADKVSQCLICRMIPEIRRNLPGYLEDELGVHGPDSERVYETLMEEDSETAAKREMLKGEKTKFEKALSSIEGLEMGGADGATVTNGLSNGSTTGGLSFSRSAGERGSDVAMEEMVQGDEA